MEIKQCRCCGFVTHQLRKRVCPDCGVAAIWDRKPESQEMKTERAAMQRLIKSLLIDADEETTIERSAF
tara:strand:+ start:122 stop:328 length:207 start_codon:yes stop_codon:yes gene_type:complete